MPGLGEEAPVGERVVVAGVGRDLKKTLMPCVSSRSQARRDGSN